MDLSDETDPEQMKGQSIVNLVQELSMKATITIKACANNNIKNGEWRMARSATHCASQLAIDFGQSPTIPH